MLHFLPKRNSCHVESNKKENLKDSKHVSEGYLERKTRNGSVISINPEVLNLKGADLCKDELIKSLKMAVKKLMEESANNKRSYIYGNVTTELCG